MRYAPILLSMLLCYLPPAAAQLSINFNTPGVSIGINVPVYPQFERVPGYPVYYAPRMNSNYFFYDGLYWVFNGDNWYASSWYNGPWGVVDPFYVPAYVLRVPVRYYRHAPTYFHGWRANDPPRWGDHWGNSWQERRGGWDKWNRSSAPAPAPLPTYQRQYSGDRYPQATQQVAIQTQNYRYQPKEAVAQQHFQQQRAHAPSAQPQQAQRPPPPHAPVAREEQAPKAKPQQAQRHSPQAPVEREQPAPRQEAKGKDQGRDSKEKDGHEKEGREKGG
jgi:hypothetical protein